jgi:molybdopterin synthase sulfur carrier subunit
MSRPVTIPYFAWLRERVGKGSEDVVLPAGVDTIADVVAWLRERGPEYAAAFAKPQTIRAAVDQQHVKPTASVRGAREIAFFPPVTGG